MLTDNDIKEINNLFEKSKKSKSKETKSIRKGGRRTKEKWENQFKISQKIFESLSELAQLNDDELIRDACVAFRNPVVFDNQVSDATFELPYHIPGYSGESMTKDHLVGMSNIVLYIYENKIYERWNSVSDFINTLKALQVLLTLPKSLNDKGTFKSWQFDRLNINNCIYWNKKLNNENITYVIDSNNNRISIDDIWNEWYENNKKFL
jgi:hypothetical protein